MYYSQRGLGREPERTRGGGFGVEALADNDSSWKDKKLRGDAKTCVLLFRMVALRIGVADDRYMVRGWA